MNIFKREQPGLDAPLAAPGRNTRGSRAARSAGGSGSSNERFGRWSEGIARGMGTPWFLFVLTLVCVLWIAWNTFGPDTMRFDSAALGFTALTLILSLQASYAAPLILLAQNRQDDRDRVQIEQDRQRAERNLADTEFLAREVVALRLAMKDLADRDFVRAELRALLTELDEVRAERDEARSALSAEHQVEHTTVTHEAQVQDSPDVLDAGQIPVPDAQTPPHAKLEGADEDGR